jgi:hypothetical protein
MWMFLSLLLVAAPIVPSPMLVAPEAPQRIAREGVEAVHADLLCSSERGLVYLVRTDSGAELRRLDRQAAVVDRLALTPTEEQIDPPNSAEWDCGMGRCDRTLRRTSVDGQHVLEFRQTKSLYYQDWEPETRIVETGAKDGWRAICPGGRPLLQCHTSRRTVLVRLAGDPNDEPPGWNVEYVALSHDGKETLHLGNGRVKRAHAGYEVTFTNKGYQYLLAMGAVPAAPSASLRVLKGRNQIQEEACLGWAVYPNHLDWFIPKH